MRGRKGKGDIGIPQCAAQFAAARGGNDDVLAAMYFIGSRRGIASKWERVTPKLFSGLAIECAQFQIACTAAEDQPPPRGHGSSEVCCACFGDALAGQVRVFTQRNLPGNSPR